MITVLKPVFGRHFGSKPKSIFSEFLVKEKRYGGEGREEGVISNPHFAAQTLEQQIIKNYTLATFMFIPGQNFPSVQLR